MLIVVAAKSCGCCHCCFSQEIIIKSRPGAWHQPLNSLPLCVCTVNSTSVRDESQVEYSSFLVTYMQFCIFIRSIFIHMQITLHSERYRIRSIGAFALFVSRIQRVYMYWKSTSEGPDASSLESLFTRAKQLYFSTATVFTAGDRFCSCECTVYSQ